jgi:hypothetical protein
MNARCVEAEPDHSSKQEINRSASDSDARSSCDSSKAKHCESEHRPVQGAAIADESHYQDRSHVIEDR